MSKNNKSKLTTIYRDISSDLSNKNKNVLELSASLDNQVFPNVATNSVGVLFTTMQGQTDVSNFEIGRLSFTPTFAGDALVSSKFGLHLATGGALSTDPILTFDDSGDMGLSSLTLDSTGDPVINFKQDGNDPTAVLGVDDTDNKFKINYGTELQNTSTFEIDGNGVTIQGQLTVNGDMTTISTTNTEIKDSRIEINNGVVGNNTSDTGIIIERGDLTNVFFGWDESEDKIVFKTTNATGSTDGDDLTFIGDADLTIGNILLNGSIESSDNTGFTMEATAAEDKTLTISASNDGAGNGLIALSADTVTLDGSIQSSDDTGFTLVADDAGNKTLTISASNTGAGNGLIALNGDGISGTLILDEDNMASNSDTHLATQKSIKAYVDANAGGGGTIDNDVNNRITTAKGTGTGDLNAEANLTFDGTTLTLVGTLDVSGASQLSLDSTDDTNLTMVADDAGNKTLTISASNDGAGNGLIALNGDGISGSLILGENNMASNSDTHLATQQSIKAYVDASVLTIGNDADNRITTAKGDGDLNAEANLTFDGTDLTLTSSTTEKPTFNIINTNADSTGSTLKFYKNSASPANSDVINNIKFNSNSIQRSISDFTFFDHEITHKQDTTSVKRNLEYSEHDIKSFNDLQDYGVTEIELVSGGADYDMYPGFGLPVPNVLYLINPDSGSLCTVHGFAGNALPALGDISSFEIVSSGGNYEVGTIYETYATDSGGISINDGYGATFRVLSVGDGAISTVSISGVGRSYNIGDIGFIFNTTTFNQSATYEVTGVGGSGEITSVEITNGGSGYAIGQSFQFSPTTGTGILEVGSVTGVTSSTNLTNTQSTVKIGGKRTLELSNINYNYLNNSNDCTGFNIKNSYSTVVENYSSGSNGISSVTNFTYLGTVGTWAIGDTGVFVDSTFNFNGASYEINSINGFNQPNGLTIIDAGSGFNQGDILYLAPGGSQPGSGEFKNGNYVTIEVASTTGTTTNSTAISSVYFQNYGLSAYDGDISFDQVSTVHIDGYPTMNGGLGIPGATTNVVALLVNGGIHVTDNSGLGLQTSTISFSDNTYGSTISSEYMSGMGSGANLNITSGSSIDVTGVTDADSSGNLILSSATGTTSEDGLSGGTGNVELKSNNAGDATGTGDGGNSGDLTIETGDGGNNTAGNGTGGNSGAITITTGAGGVALTTGNSGNINVTTGDGVDVGTLSLTTGNGTTGGDISLYTQTSGGDISLTNQNSSAKTQISTSQPLLFNNMLTVTQLTSKSTSVTIDRHCGRIITHNASLGANTSVEFTVNNNLVLASYNCVIMVNLNHANYSSYSVEALQTGGTGVFVIRLTNNSGGALSDAVQISFLIFNID